MKTIIAVALLVTASSAVAGPKEVVPEPTTHVDWSKVREQAEAFLVRDLVDPESARIKWTKGFFWTSWKQGNLGFANKRSWGWLACGTLNAKNRLGGYAGAEKVVMSVMPDGTIKAGMAYSIDSECTWDSDRFGPVVEELAAR